MAEVSPTPHQLLVEAVVFWAIGVVIFVGRIISRSISNGSIRNLHSDDYLMTATFGIYTTLLILIQVSAKYATNLFPADQLDEILADPDDVANRVYGSKIVIGLEQCMLLSTWGVKACLVTMYWKLTQRSRWHPFVQVLAGYIALGLVVIEITYFAVYCRPFPQYWAVPPNNAQCATYQHYSITQAVFNISSDALMLVIPIPLLKGTQMPIRKKVLLISVMSLGLFVIIAAILNKYFNFHSPDTTLYQLWYIREASTAIYVANLMCWWPLLRKIFGSTLSQYNSKSAKYGGPSQHRSGALADTVRSTTTRHSISAGVLASETPHHRWWRPKGAVDGTDSTQEVLSPSNSQEAINMPTRRDFTSESSSEPEVPLEIWRKVEYNVEETQDSPRR